ncbi:unnamed protein product [Trifolium pratense]|uniref:Uncharacterized protein n=2 Tax=Trifolium pratense TaxID=57577 RepID=A0ACB0KCH8_TRIPR|nr:unnamed protein product [Trifolium pratense]
MAGRHNERCNGCSEEILSTRYQTTQELDKKMEATSKDDEVKVWGKETSNHEGEKKEESPVRSSVEMDPH